MAIPDNDIKLLWGRAAGICSNPSCRKDLTVLLEGSRAFNVGEMAHVIAKSPGGPRGRQTGGDDTYANLILLCPTCHTLVDKAPEGTYPASLLREWKTTHEAHVRQIGRNVTFESAKSLKEAVRKLLLENRILWRDLGPESNVAANNPGSNLYRIWDLRKLDTIVPNNRKIVNYIEANSHLLSHDELALFMTFKNHAAAFEQHQYARLDDYPRFPRDFGAVFE